MEKLIILADVKEYLPLLDRGEITISRFAELLNNRANKAMITTKSSSFTFPKVDQKIYEETLHEVFRHNQAQINKAKNVIKKS